MKMSVKIALLVVASLLSAASFIISPSHAASNAYVGISPSLTVGIEHAPCTGFTISVVVENVSQMKTLSLNLSYDPQIISCRGYILAHAEELDSVQIAAYDGRGFFFMNISFKDGLTSVDSTQMANVSFYILKRGETFINLTVMHIEDSTGNPITFEVLNGYFSNLNPYDINKDGRIDIADVAMVAYALGSYPGHPRWNPDADVNDDGVVDIRDVVLVAGYFGSY